MASSLANPHAFGAAAAGSPPHLGVTQTLGRTMALRTAGVTWDSGHSGSDLRLLACRLPSSWFDRRVSAPRKTRPRASSLTHPKLLPSSSFDDLSPLPFPFSCLKQMICGEVQARQTLSVNASYYDWSAVKRGRDCNLGYRGRGEGSRGGEGTITGILSLRGPRGSLERFWKL